MNKNLLSRIATLVVALCLLSCGDSVPDQGVVVDVPVPQDINQCKTTEHWDVMHPKFQMYCPNITDVNRAVNSAGVTVRGRPAPQDVLPDPGTITPLTNVELGSISEYFSCQILGYEGWSRVNCRKNCECSDTCTDTMADWLCDADDPTALTYFGRGDGHTGFGFDELDYAIQDACGSGPSRCAGGENPDDPIDGDEDPVTPQ